MGSHSVTCHPAEVTFPPCSWVCGWLFSRSMWRPCSVSRCRAIVRARTCGSRASSTTRSSAVGSVNRPPRGSPTGRDKMSSTSDIGSSLSFHRTTCTDQCNGFVVMFPPAFTVPMPPGNSWNCVCKISRTWKVLENESGPRKSWKYKSKVLESPGKWVWYQKVLEI